jgi:hypothetical protein
MTTFRVRLFVRSGGAKVVFNTSHNPNPTVLNLRSRAIKKLELPLYRVDQGALGGGTHDEQLQGSEILIFNNEDEAKIPLEDGILLVEDGAYTALERFSVVPVNLFRRVPPSKIHPAVVTATEPGDNNALSSRSPLFCASFAQDEYNEFPFAGSGGEGNVQCCGISLEYTRDGQAFDPNANGHNYPWTPMTDTEQNNRRLSIKLDQGNAFTAPPTSPWRYLHATQLHETEPYAEAKVADEVTRKRATANVAAKRSNYYLFMLPKGTDLSDLGVAVVFDRPNHFVLICVSPPSPGRYWGSQTGPNEHHTWRPMSTNAAFTERENLGRIDIANKRYPVVLPNVASRFHLHSFLLVAAAEPKNIRGSSEDGSKPLFAAAQGVFKNTSKIDNAYETGEALELLELANYNPDCVLHHSLKTLDAAMTSVCKMLEWRLPVSEDDEGEDDGEATQIQQDYNALCDGMKEIFVSLKKASAGSTGEA